MTSYHKIPMFSRDDFDDWKIRMQAHLAAQDDDMWYVITNGPMKITKINTAFLSSSDEPQRLEKPRIDWTNEDKRKANLDNIAKDILYKTLDKNMFSKIKMCTTAKEIWEKLVQICEGNEQTRENKLTVALQKYENIRMKQEETLSEFEERFSTVNNELAGLGRYFSNRELALKVIRALPREWDVKTMAMRASNLNELELHDMFADLKAYELELKIRAEEDPYPVQPTKALAATSSPSATPVTSTSEETAVSPTAEQVCNDAMALFVKRFGKFIVKSNFSKQFKNKDHTKDGRSCFNCGDPGHFADTCRKPKKDQKKEEYRNRGKQRYSSSNKKKHQKVLIAQERGSKWADSDSDNSASYESSSSSDDEEVTCLMALEDAEDQVGRSGHTVVKANSVLILFGGEDSKKRKLNDMHMFDLKSLTWLPLHCTGPRPSPRSNHVAALYDDKILLVFGGASKSRTLNDLYSLDFETMVWSRVKTRSFHPSPRAGCCGALCGTKWYIIGGGSKKKPDAETLIFDVLKLEWSVAVASPSSSITTNKGFSLVLVQHRERDFLVAFGGFKKDASDQVEVLVMEKIESSIIQKSTLSKVAGLLSENCASSVELSSQPNNVSLRGHFDSVSRLHLASASEQHASGRKSLSESLLVGSNSAPGNVSFSKQFNNQEENAEMTIMNVLEDKNQPQLRDQNIKPVDVGAGISSGGDKIAEETYASESDNLSSLDKQGSGSLPSESDGLVFPESDGKSRITAQSNIYQVYEAKLAALLRKNGTLEGQLTAALAGREAAEKNLLSSLKSRQEMEKKLADIMKELEFFKEKLNSVELAHEEANSLSNIVHSDNVRLEHDVAFLKAVLDDTQKELHSTRGVLAGERARAFQLQVEVFHLKQRLQSLETRTPTPRKPFHV